MNRKVGLTPPDPARTAGSLADWAASGLMALTGPANNKPLLIDRDLVGRINALRTWVATLSDRPILVPQSYIVGRAALMGFSRQGATSCNGSARLLRARDGWFVLNLARRDDVDLLPALFESELADSDWPMIEHMVSTRSTERLTAQAALLGLPAGALDAGWEGPPIGMTPLAGELRKAGAPLVVDMSSLWAGPLCGAILADSGAQVIKVESRQRPDASRFGCPMFFDLLNQSKEAMLIDFGDDADVRQLGNLLRRADIVVEASRPRALAQLGLARERIARDNPGMVWVSITGHGQDGTDALRVGFGDDAAAIAGLVAWQEGAPHFIGDALADPIAGLMAAGAVLAARRAGHGCLIDIALRASAAWAGAGAPIAQRSARVIGNDRDGFAIEQAGALHPVRTPAQIFAEEA